jgi:hypothetical protein
MDSWHDPLALPPDINVSALPEAEREAAFLLSTSLFGLGNYVNRFAAALSLFDFSALLSTARGYGSRQPHWPIGEWHLIAAREAAMAVYHFARAKESVDICLSQCPTLDAKVDRAALRRGGKLLRGSFPDFEEMRHAVAHTAELTRDPSQAREHSITEPVEFGGVRIGRGARGILRENLSGRTFFSTYRGKLRQCEVSQRSFDALNACRREIYSAFVKHDA